ncbi:hypothetical protein cypCar_00027686 [Cyprinus carpio]|nr:hypothetical protein cypCar_00027686 [Cyprinus carpio]
MQSTFTKSLCFLCSVVGVILESPVHPVTEGDTLTVHCLYPYTSPPNLRADFYKDGSLIQNQTTEMIISTVSKSHEGFYYCKHSERGESPKSWISVRMSHSESQISVLHTLSSVLAVCPYLLVTVVLIFKCCRMRGKRSDSFEATQNHVFSGDTVTLRCDIDGEGVTSWQYIWYKDGSANVFSELQEHTFSPVTESDAGKYFCYGAERGGSRSSNISDAVTLTVSDKAQTVLSVSPQKWLTEGDSVTLICEVYGSTSCWIQPPLVSPGFCSLVPALILPEYPAPSTRKSLL